MSVKSVPYLGVGLPPLLPHVHTVDPLAPEAPPKPARNIAVRGAREAGEVNDYYALPRLRDEL